MPSEPGLLHSFASVGGIRASKALRCVQTSQTGRLASVAAAVRSLSQRLLTGTDTLAPSLSHTSREDQLLQLLRAVARHCIHTICYVQMEDGQGTSGQAKGYMYAQNPEKGKQIICMMLLATQYKS